MPKKKTSSLIIIIAYKLVYIIVPSEERAHTHTHTRQQRTNTKEQQTYTWYYKSLVKVCFIHFIRIVTFFYHAQPTQHQNI